MWQMPESRHILRGGEGMIAGVAGAGQETSTSHVRTVNRFCDNLCRQVIWHLIFERASDITNHGTHSIDNKNFFYI